MYVPRRKTGGKKTEEASASWYDPRVPTAAAGRRKDAQRNHVRLLDAARSVFAAAGPTASLEEIARTAGVGIGTLYRHFPSRADLVAGLFEDESARWHEIARRALVAVDVEDGFRRYVAELCVLQARIGPVGPMLAEHEGAAAAQAELGRLAEELILRAKEEGVVREDFTLADLAMLFWSLSHLVGLCGDDAPEAWRRHLGFMLDGLRPEAASVAAAEPLDDARLRAVAERAGRR